MHHEEWYKLISKACTGSIKMVITHRRNAKNSQKEEKQGSSESAGWKEKYKQATEQTELLNLHIATTLINGAHLAIRFLSCHKHTFLLIMFLITCLKTLLLIFKAL